MRDVRLWELMLSGTGEVQELCKLLDDAAELPLLQRMPFFGAFESVLKHPQAAVRQRAVQMLAGVTGLPGLRWIVETMNDPKPAVRRAAVHALAESAKAQPERFAHAVFHPDPIVRQTAVAADVPDKCSAYLLHLLADPECHDLVVAKLEDLPITGEAIAVLISLLRHGSLPRPLARRLIAESGWKPCDGLNDRQHLRPAKEDTKTHEAILAWDGDDPSPAVGAQPDALDDLVDLFSDDEAEQEQLAGTEQTVAEHFFNQLHVYTSRHPTLANHAATSLLLTGIRRGGFSTRAAQVCAGCYAEFFTFKWVSLQAKKEAIAGLYAAGENATKRTKALVRALILDDTTDPPRPTPLCATPDGGFNLYTIGGLLHLLPDEPTPTFVDHTPYRWVVEWLGPRTIAETILADPVRALPFLSIRHFKRRALAPVMDALRKCGDTNDPSLITLLIRGTSVDKLEFLDEIPNGLIRQVLGVLFDQELRLGHALSDAHASYLAKWITNQLPPARTRSPLLDLMDVLQKNGERHERHDGIASLLALWLSHEPAQESRLGLEILSNLAGELESDDLCAISRILSTDHLARLLRAITAHESFPQELERALAEALIGHADSDVRYWADQHFPGRCAPRPTQRIRVVDESARRLSLREQDEIATCDESALPAAVACCLAEPTSGLCNALARRPDPNAPHAEVCTALLASHDPVDEVAEAFVRFGSEDGDFLTEVELEVAGSLSEQRHLPLLGHAWLHRLDVHRDAFAERTLLPDGTPDAEGLIELLDGVRQLPSSVLRRQLWQAVAAVVADWRWRDRAKLAKLFQPALVKLLVSQLTEPIGREAATILMRAYYAHVAPDQFDANTRRVAELFDGLSGETRHTLRPWISPAGLGSSPHSGRAVAPRINKTTLAESVSEETDIKQLAAYACDPVGELVEDAILRLLQLGPPGEQKLADLLVADPPLAPAGSIAQTVKCWQDERARSRVRAWVGNRSIDPELRFIAATGLLESGMRDVVPVIYETICTDTTEPGWFRDEDWQYLLSFGMPEDDLASELVTSPHPQAYEPAVEHLLKHASGNPVVAASRLLAFLDVEGPRHEPMRYRAAEWLWQDSHTRDVFPVLALGAADFRTLGKSWKAIVATDAEMGTWLVASVLIVGDIRARTASFELPVILNALKLRQKHLNEVCSRILVDCSNATVRAWAREQIAPGTARSGKLLRIAEAFAWGVRRGRELTGRALTVHMTDGEQLGYTHLDSDEVWVTPLPILRQERDGNDIVRALILHEIGHHAYHRGKPHKRAWKKAARKHLGPLLNLVADEHLERNLRSVDRGFGDKLKKLAAYAFQHSDKEVEVDVLLDALQAHSFDVLSKTPLEIARNPQAVRVAGGRVLVQMEKLGSSFARFVRALRMGLGNRHNDPKVAEALGLFKGSFKESTADELLEIARELRRIFGDEAELLQAMAQSPTTGTSEGDMDIHGEGIKDADVQREVERILRPPKKAKDDERKGRAVINVGPDEQFDTINHIVPVPPDPAAHEAIVAKVKRDARRLRRYFDQLGLAHTPRRHRTSGRRVDATRIQPLVLRGDPRVLISRELVTTTDLFLGVLVDCSLSMHEGDNITKAKMFAILLATAARQFGGIDLRVFGFTDDTLFDAGDANRCAAASLSTQGGNNDAAALWHMAQLAAASKRKAKLIVMISDGLPTECSVKALRQLVRKVTFHMNICCAQVAVRPLEEICFPHYVLLEEEQLATSVRAFGTVITKLVRKAMRR